MLQHVGDQRRGGLASHALVIALAAVVIASTAGCRVYDPALVDGQDAGPSGDCTLREPPVRPAVDDGDDGPEVAFGLRMVVMAQGDEWPSFGYDVDSSCTVAPDLEAECTPPSSSRAPIDGPNGVDNVFGQRFFPLVALTTPDLESESRSAQEAGQGLPIVRIFGWNGQDDDPRIEIHVMQAVFGAPGGDETEPPEPPADPESSRPVWDGRDWFWVRSDAFRMGDITRPLIRDDNAYVAGRTIVARLPDRVEIIFPADMYGVRVYLTGAIVTGRISDDGDTLENVLVSGRWSIEDLLDTAENVGICPGSTEYGLLMSQLDTIADVRSVPGTGGEGVRCDAISLGVGFTGTRMRVAELAEGPPLANPCEAGGSDAGVPDGGT